jgi:hypothetical protein
MTITPLATIQMAALVSFGDSRHLQTDWTDWELYAQEAYKSYDPPGKLPCNSNISPLSYIFRLRY